MFIVIKLKGIDVSFIFHRLDKMNSEKLQKLQKEVRIGGKVCITIDNFTVLIVQPRP